MTTHQKKHIKNINSKELIICNENNGEYYGQITEAQGNSRFLVKIIKSNLIVSAKLAGRIIKGPNKQKIFKEDFILLQKDIYTNDNKYYIIHKYKEDDIKKLKKTGELVFISNDVFNDSESDQHKVYINFSNTINSNDITESINLIDDEFIANI